MRSERMNACIQVLESFREKLKRFLEEVKDRKKDRKKQAARIAAQMMQTPRTPTVSPCPFTRLYPRVCIRRVYLQLGNLYNTWREQRRPSRAYTS